MNLKYFKSKTNFSVTLWLFLLTIMTFFMIVIGGLTRLTDSGLSMVDWRPIMGTIPPLSHQSWLNVFNDYKTSPEFQIVNKYMTLEDFKYIFWWEWFHRFFARCIGIIFVFPLIFFLITKKIKRSLLITLIFVFLFGLFQALVGWWMVKSGLNENPYVSAYRLVFHLINALIIFSILFWTSLNSLLIDEENIIVKNKKINYLFHICLLLILVTIISGGFMAGTNAGNSFNTFPLMNKSFIPEGYYLDDYKWLNIFENTVAINFNHRWLASFTFVFIFAFIFYLLISQKYNIIRYSLILVLFFVTLQFILGVLTLIYNVPISLASFHQTNSTLLLASLLYAYHSYKYNFNKNLKI